MFRKVLLDLPFPLHMSQLYFLRHCWVNGNLPTFAKTKHFTSFCVCVRAIVPTDKALYMDPHISVKDEPTSDDDVTHSWCNPVQPSQMDYSHEGKLGYITFFLL